MSSERKIKSARENGRRSHGPVTKEGKARSSQNAYRHGMFSRCVIVGAESPEVLQNLVEEQASVFEPANGVQQELVEEMSSAIWRMRRLWAIEKEWMDQGLESQQADHEITRIANTFGALAETSKYKVLQRYEGRMHRLYQRSLKTLLHLQDRKQQKYEAETKNEGTNPIPISDTIEK